MKRKSTSNARKQKKTLKVKKTHTHKSSTNKQSVVSNLSLTKALDEQQKQLRKHLDERLQNLYVRTALLERELLNLNDYKFYRTCIFGSARIKPETKLYKDVSNLARFLAWEGIDVLTGGGPGLMEAANQGAAYGKQERKTKAMTYGLSIELPFEPDNNKHLDVKRHHQKFSSRLDDFMRLSHSIICTPGGIGTVLELFFSWQLIQVKHIDRRPIVLMGKEFWQGLIDWMMEFPLDQKLVSPEDFDVISIVDSPEDAAELIVKHHKDFREKTLTMPRK